ncbi:MAG TPA: dephospho-CoA kinase [Chitinophagaceae bacterium]|nr:dephospho-CoA kinase [Chitinophagaceae bacterium]
MYRVGLTGGIGSGKSTVARILETLGIPVYYADDAAKQIMNTDLGLRKQLQQQFGEASYVDGQLDRKYLAGIVFNDPEKLSLLNSLIHPVTIRHSEQWFRRQSAPYAVREAALLFESGASENLDFIIGVYAPRQLRLQRVIKRDGISTDEILKRMSRQINEEMKMKLCDAVIRNDEQELVIPQVMEIHQLLLETSGEGKSQK